MVVYLITNRLNGKQYVGQTTDTVQNRFKGHCCIKSGTKCAIRSAIHKYGKENFSYRVLSVCSNQEELNDSEIYFIDHYQTLAPSGYNIMEGGSGAKHSEESKRKMSFARKGKQKPNKGCWPSVPVLCIETNVSYPSVNKAAFELKLQRANIQKVLYGERAHTGGYTFRRVET